MPGPLVAALLRERAGYVARGLTDRVDLVDQQLRAAGESPAGPEQATVTPVESPGGARPAVGPRRSGRPRSARGPAEQ